MNYFRSFVVVFIFFFVFGSLAFNSLMAQDTSNKKIERKTLTKEELNNKIQEELSKINFNRLSKEDMFKVYKMSSYVKDKEQSQTLLKIAASGLLSTGESKIYNAKLKRLITDSSTFESLMVVKCSTCNASPVKKTCAICKGNRDCSRCKGQGVERFPQVGGGYKQSSCYKCNGSGRCPNCAGVGNVAKKCSTCNGKGETFTRDQARAICEELVINFLNQSAEEELYVDNQEESNKAENVHVAKADVVDSIVEQSNREEENIDVPQEMTVKATGYGINESYALEDAFKNAIRKVVGTYVVSQEKEENGNVDESIYLNSDAVVTQHKVLEEKQQGEIVVLEIEATIIKNNLLKYVNKTKSQKIESRDLGNLLSHRQALVGAEKSLEYIFQDYSEKINIGIKKGDLYLGAQDDPDNNNISLGVNYEIRFNQEEYSILQQRLKNLFSRFAVEKFSGEVDNYDKFFEDSRDNGVVVNIYSKDNIDKWPKGTKIIFFINDVSIGNRKKYKYECYAIPSQLFEKTAELISESGVIEFNFLCDEHEKPIRRYLPITSCFHLFVPLRKDGHGEDYVMKNYVSGRRINQTGVLLFNNWWSYFSVKKFGGGFPSVLNSTTKKELHRSFEYKNEWMFQEEDVRSMKSCELKIYTGKKAACLYNIFEEKNKREVYNIAVGEHGYIPAMLGLAEHFDETEKEYWYNRAALLGSLYAQQKAGWKNAGLGFEIHLDKKYNYVVVSAERDSKAKKGLVLESMNGIAINKDINEVSQMVGSLNPGETITVKFKNGKTIDFVAQ